MTEVITRSAAETVGLGKVIGERLRPGDVIAYRGGLGAGKTTITRGIAIGMGLGDEVSSPTFALVNDYEGGSTQLCHFDMYRIGSEDELDAAITLYKKVVSHIHVTELDIRANEEMGGALQFSTEGVEVSDSLKQHLADQYARVFRVLRKHKDVIDNVTNERRAPACRENSLYQAHPFADNPANGAGAPRGLRTGAL